MHHKFLSKFQITFSPHLAYKQLFLIRPIYQPQKNIVFHEYFMNTTVIFFALLYRRDILFKEAFKPQFKQFRKRIP